ncbi:MAG: MBL fold metallo-hydrolase [Candidatus Paceibacterota bacterium]|jgi:competence protein ComEC
MIIRKIKIGTLLFLILSVFIVWYYVLHESRGGVLTVAMLNIGQGDAIFIESPTGKQIIIDGGPDSSLLRELSKVMPFYDKSIDMIVVTNPDSDHFAGFIPLLDRYQVSAILEPGTINHGIYDTLETSIIKHGLKKVIAERGMKIDIGDGAYLVVLFPDRDAVDLASNTGSIVMKLIYGETSYMLTGDSVKEIENYLITLDGAKLKSNVLKVGHHGSRTSTGENFIKSVAPEYALISAGIGNSYGHPHKEILGVLEKAGVKVLGTYKEGTIISASDGKSINFSLIK